MGVLRDPLHPKGQALTPSRRASDKIPKNNRRATDRMGEESRRYPDAEWPMTTAAERIHLVSQIEADLANKVLDPISAYHERLHWAFRCMKEGV